MSSARNRAEIRKLLHQYTTQLLLQTHEEAQLKVNLEAEKVGAAPIPLRVNCCCGWPTQSPHAHAPCRCCPT